MRYDRYTPVHAGMLACLRHARSMRGVVLIDPTSLKSLMLKFIEGVAILQGEVPTEPTGEQPPAEAELMGRLRRLLGLRNRRPRPGIDRSRKRELVRETRTLEAVLGVFRSSCGLLDEVQHRPPQIALLIRPVEGCDAPDHPP